MFNIASEQDSSHLKIPAGQPGQDRDRDLEHSEADITSSVHYEMAVRQ
jgi:hypothetical protein